MKNLASPKSTSHLILKRHLLALAVSTGLGLGGTVQAANFDVTVMQDQGDGTDPTNTGTLSWAIRQANAAAGTDTITLKTDVVVQGVMKSLIDSDLTLQNDGSPRSISGNNTYRPLFIKSGTVKIKNLTLKDGKAKGGDSYHGGGGAGLGGALFVYQGNVSLEGVDFVNNQAIGGSGGVAAIDATGNSHYGAGGGGMLGNASLLGGGGLFASAKGYFGGYGGNGKYSGGLSAFGGGGSGSQADGSLGDKGGFGGGGGAAVDSGGTGGFGGGGGHGGSNYSYLGGGNGGFGGGGGSSTYNSLGLGGYGGGNAKPNSGGGGGAGFGGAIFAMRGQIWLHNVSFNNDTVLQGKGSKSINAGVPPSDDGSAAGKDLFICSHSLGATASLCAATVTQCEDLNLASNNVFGNFSNNFCLLNVDSAGGGLIPLENFAESDDFGSVDIDSGTNTHSYKLSNPNNYAVTVLLAVTDDQMQTTSDFKVSSPNLTVPAHGTAEFSVEFNPTAVGAHTGLVQAKLSGRADKFYVQGTGKLDSPPVANPTKQVIKVLEDAANTELNLSPFFSDPDGDVISLSLGNNTNSNLVTPSLNGGILTLTYAPNQNGFASVQVFAQSKNKSVILPVEITVEPVDDAPTVNQPINTTTVDEDAPNTAIDLSTIFKDIEDDAISFSLVNNNNPGLVQASLNNTNKTLNLTYLPNQHGSAAITIRATANGKTVDASFPVLVNPVDDLPTVSQPIAAVTVDEDAPNTVLDLSSTFSDVDGDTIDLQVVANTNSSLVKPTLTGKSLSLAYSPNQNGLATITIRATANGKTVDTTVPVMVKLVDDAPVVSQPIAAVTVDEDAASTELDLSSSFSDVDTEKIDLQVLTNTNERLVQATLTDKKLSLTYSPNQSGTATITLRATANGQIVDSSFTVTVRPVDDAPIVSNKINDVSVEQGAADTVLDLSAVFTDIDKDTLSLQVIGNSVPSLVQTSLSDNSLTLSYNPKQSGSTTIVLRATANGKTATTFFNVVVNAKNAGLDLTGNGQSIANGDNSPIGADYTSFAAQTVAAGSETHIYTISNSSNLPIAVDLALAEVTGAASAVSGLERLVADLNPIQAAWAVGMSDFTLNTNSVTVPANSSSSFTITFDPSSVGTKEAIVNLSVSSKLVYSFRIAGVGTEETASPPKVVTPIAAVTVNENAPNTLLDLSATFADPENKAISLSMVGNTNTALVTPSLNGNQLSLAYTPNQSGTATLTIRATADGESVETSFTVTVKANATPIPVLGPFGLLASILGLLWFGVKRRQD